MEGLGTPLDAQTALMASRQTPTLRQTSDPVQARKVAEDFEAFVLAQYLQPMFAELDTDGPMGGGHAESVWRTMQVDEYGKALARSGGIGIADMVMNEILKMQED